MNMRSKFDQKLIIEISTCKLSVLDHFEMTNLRLLAETDPKSTVQSCPASSSLTNSLVSTNCTCSVNNLVYLFVTTDHILASLSSLNRSVLGCTVRQWVISVLKFLQSGSCFKKLDYFTLIVLFYLYLFMHVHDDYSKD